MVRSNGKTFAVGHGSIPIVWLAFYWRHHETALAVLIIISALWCAYLLSQAFALRNLGDLLRRRTSGLFLLTDACLLALSYLLVDWDAYQAHPTWLVLLLIPLYAAETGIRNTVLSCLLSLAVISLYDGVSHSALWSIDTFLILMGMLFIVLFIARGQEKLNRMAYYDPLTSLPNRIFFTDILHDRIVQARKDRAKMFLMFLDLDQFKYINDTMGHDAGDDLLVEVAQRIGRLLPPGSSFARMGGDEFTLLPPSDFANEEAAALAQAIIHALGDPVIIKGQDVYVGASIGICLYPRDGEDAAELLKNADSAMYRAKESGRNNYQFFSPRPQGLPFGRITMETMLRKAIEVGEIEVFYQPRINPRKGTLISAEALARWRHPGIGLISPKEFIPFAEERGLIIPLGELVLKKVCGQIRDWLDKDIRMVPISVNLSPRQFHQQALPRTIGSILDQYQVPAALLELEITETSAMQNTQYATNLLTDLKRMGLRILIDDFGTGYSSLHYLKRFPLDGLKIDSSFTSGIGDDPDDAVIVSSIMAIAQAMGLKVIAEGVETMEQLAFLIERGCSEIQGYLFSKPIPPREMEKWLVNGYPGKAGNA